MRKLKTILLAAVAVALLALPAAAQARRGDRDNDRLPDRWEKHFRLSTHHNDRRGDRDRDGLSNRGEYLAHTNPRRKDSDRDRVWDDNEDRDHDHVDNGNEMREGTNPGRRDSDRDGRRDDREDRDHDHLNNGAEDQTGNDPIDRDTDDDGVIDGNEQAGTVVSFTNGVLTIDLANGGQVSGRVTSATRIECENEDEAEDHHTSAGAASSGPGHDGSGDDSGEHSGSNSGPGHAGEDNSGPGRADDDGDNDGEHHNGEARDRTCPGGTANLVPGARVHEAELQATSTGATWEEVELLN